jgi:hypothetical protein
MTEVTLFIPRILTSVSKKQITEYFIQEKIGYCSNIKAKYRINAKGFKYWFAFITIQFFDTPTAHTFYEKVVEEEKTISIDYFDKVLKDKRYWEISLRNLEKKQKKTEKKKYMELEDGQILETNFGQYEHMDIYNDYLQFEKEIFNSNYDSICLE